MFAERKSAFQPCDRSDRITVLDRINHRNGGSQTAFSLASQDRSGQATRLYFTTA